MLKRKRSTFAAPNDPNSSPSAPSSPAETVAEATEASLLLRLEPTPEAAAAAGAEAAATDDDDEDEEEPWISSMQRCAMTAASAGGRPADGDGAAPLAVAVAVDVVGRRYLLATSSTALAVGVARLSDTALTSAFKSVSACPRAADHAVTAEAGSE